MNKGGVMKKLLIDEAKGIHIPQHFYENFDLASWGLNSADYTELSDPYHENYWDAWDEVLRNAKFVDPEGKAWYLEQDGDLWSHDGEDEDSGGENEEVQ